MPCKGVQECEFWSWALKLHPVTIIPCSLALISWPLLWIYITYLLYVLLSFWSYSADIFIRIYLLVCIFTINSRGKSESNSFAQRQWPLKQFFLSLGPGEWEWDAFGCYPEVAGWLWLTACSFTCSHWNTLSHQERQGSWQWEVITQRILQPWRHFRHWWAAAAGHKYIYVVLN